MDKPDGAKKYLKQCEEGWKCPLCGWCFETYSAYRHLLNMHLAEYQKAMAAAQARSPLRRQLTE